MLDKTILIISGVSGSGKSTIASLLKKGLNNPDHVEIISADNYPLYYEYDRESGKYVYYWNRETCSAAHKWCFEQFEEALEYCSVIILDNTNLTERDYRRYVKLAKSKNFEIKVLTIEPQHDMIETYAERNTHGVTKDVLEKQYLKLKGKS